ncbi:hypothetical protein [Alkalimarinus alittae]|uniref:Uncharacterized protein n=1 Tax=Alkalimarinus alittae TaxID=2961619 RepID=A0ABY6N5K3_9ALTE|nr:hypothetical protein [Alkalimarinus alittae]UZE97284.1 hypothetical protein NKI27_05905 [Alkalimarinus alittae]
MGKVIRVNFNHAPSIIAYSADVYSQDMKKHQFQLLSESIVDAYHAFINEASIVGVKVVKCIAIYKGTLNTRELSQPPVSVWHMQSGKHG